MIGGVEVQLPRRLRAAAESPDCPGNVGVDLGLQGFGEHPAGALADQLVDHRPTTISTVGVLSAVVGSRNYGEHGSYPSDRRSQRRSCLMSLKITGRVRPLAGHPQISSIAPCDTVLVLMEFLVVRTEPTTDVDSPPSSSRNGALTDHRRGIHRIVSAVRSPWTTPAPVLPDLRS
jgi:hypothetical protein